jgi:hypothetical protein
MSAVLIDHPSLLQCLPDKVLSKAWFASVLRADLWTGARLRRENRQTGHLALGRHFKEIPLILRGFLATGKNF